jgi:hypothetical protein
VAAGGRSLEELRQRRPTVLGKPRPGVARLGFGFLNRPLPRVYISARPRSLLAVNAAAPRAAKPIMASTWASGSSAAVGKAALVSH